MADLYHLQEAREQKDSVKKRKRKIIGLIAAIAVGIVIALIVLFYFLNNRSYNSYEVKSEVERSDSNNLGYLYHNGNILKYSRSGISAMDNRGNALWNGGFEMKQPQVDLCGDYVVVADVTGKQFFVYNGEDEGTSMETTLPIVRAKVAAQGVTAVLLQDTDSNVLNIYDPYNTTTPLLVEIPTNVSEEGYPLDFDISPDGNSLVVSYMIVKGNRVENKVSFYNFTEVGQDSNTLVGGKTFQDSMISCVEFIGEDEVAVLHEKGVTLFRGMKQPEIQAEISFEEEIKSMAYSDKYIAIVTRSKSDKQTLHLYNAKGKEVLTQEIAYDYADMKIYNDEIFFISNHHCSILRTNGHEKFDCSFENEIDSIFPTGNGSIYTLLEEEKIQRIRLKKNEER